MHDVMSPPAAHKSKLRTPVRNRYFYGKLLDVHHFELESDYLNGKRRLLNRLVTGYGVVCGLDVQPGPSKDEIVVTPGLALDRWGNEIIVPRKSAPVRLQAHGGGHEASAAPEQASNQGYQDKKNRDEDIVTVSICYHECEDAPTPVLAGDCHGSTGCEAGAIREQYRLVVAAGEAPAISTHCRFPDVISGERLDYATLARWVSGGCPAPADDPCIPLANVHLSRKGGRCEAGEIDITIRPIVYSNDLLFDLVLALMREDTQQRRDK